MSKRKKHPKLPNGYGSIRYLGKGRSNPYAVHPPTTEFTPDGIPITPKALCYVNDWYVGFAVLTAYRNGSYRHGMEQELALNGSAIKQTVEFFLSQYSQNKRFQSNFNTKLTFADVFELYYEDKYINSKKTLSKQSSNSTKAAFKNCSKIHNMIFEDITLTDLQSVIDSCTLKHSSLELIKSLYKGMYSYAIPHGIVEKDLSQYVKINIPDDDIHGIPFDFNELEILWNCRQDIVSARIFCMCHMGYRISAYRALEITDDYIVGGNKTVAGKSVLTPLHPSIKPLITFADLNGIEPNSFRKQMYSFLESVGIQRHTPHDCKHTFSMLCDKFKVHPVARMKMLGHKIDMSNDIYGHWDYEMLLPEIEKIRLPFVTNV